jgi:hypothetical protein
MYFSTHFYYGFILANLGLEGVGFRYEIEPSLYIINTQNDF